MNARQPGLTRGGFDKMGGLHPFIVWAAVLLVDLSIVMGVILVLTAGADWVEDFIWPGGPELLPF